MLKLDDGFARGRPDCKAEVMHLQRCFNKLSIHMAVDGYFGISTELAVAEFQHAHGLPVTKVVDNGTWLRIEQLLFDQYQATGASTTPDAPQADKSETASSKPTSDVWTWFRGDLAWLHDIEGHAGKTYWPGSASGITLDPGFDLGYQEPEELEKHYASMLNSAQLEACKGVLGLKGRGAKTFLNQSLDLLSIRISKNQALKVLPHIAEPYWVAVTKRFPMVKDVSCPGAVHTALLSLAFNRGPNNNALECLHAPLAQQDWQACATEIGNMQQDHALAGILKRRKMEAELITKSV